MHSRGQSGEQSWCSGLVGAGPTPVGWFAAFCGAGVSKSVSVEPQRRVSGGRAETYLGNRAGPQEPGSAHLEACGRSASTWSFGAGTLAVSGWGRGWGGTRGAENGIWQLLRESVCRESRGHVCACFSQGGWKGLPLGWRCLPGKRPLSFFFG